MRIMSLALAMVLALVALPAAAQVGWRSPGLHYFNRPGATLAQHDEAVRFCAGEAMKMLPSVSGGQYGLVGYVLLQSHADRSQVQANVETCMVVRGWTVVRVPAFDEMFLKQASQASLRAYVAKSVGLESPPGTVVRRYDPGALLIYKMGGFDAANPDTISFTAVFGPPGSKLKLPDYTPSKPEWRFPRNADPAKLAPDATVIVVRTHGTRPGQQMNVRFLNIADLPNGQPALTMFATPTPTKFLWKAGTPMEDLFVVEVPPGLWILAGDNASSFCLRAPVFDVRKGEAVFAGTISSEVAGDMQPKMDLTPARAGLPAALAGRLRPAEWRNDISFDCGLVPSTFLNAFVVKGAPPA